MLNVAIVGLLEVPLTRAQAQRSRRLSRSAAVRRKNGEPRAFVSWCFTGR